MVCLPFVRDVRVDSHASYHVKPGTPGKRVGHRAASCEDLFQHTRNGGSNVRLLKHRVVVADGPLGHSTIIQVTC